MKKLNQGMHTEELMHWGQEACAPGHEFGGVRDYYLLHIVTAGQGVYQTTGRKWTLKQGDAFLIFPGQRHQYQADMEQPWTYFWLGFTGEFSSLFGPLRITGDNPVLHYDDTSELLEIFNGIPPGRLVQHPAVTMENLGRLNTILGMLCRERNVPGGIQGQKGQEGLLHVHSMRVFIQRRFNTPVQVQDIIDFVQLERSYASRIFKKQTGLSIGEALRKARFAHAEECLKEGFSAKETAYSCGFRDYNNFLKSFKKEYGMTPGEYKA